jgi:hypothetical protein
MCKRDEVTGGQRKLHNEKVHNLYLPTDVIKLRMRWVGHVVCIEEL